MIEELFPHSLKLIDEILEREMRIEAIINLIYQWRIGLSYAQKRRFAEEVLQAIEKAV